MANTSINYIGDEDKRKHLELIQSIIARMSQNSFLIKGWSITLVSALFALAEKDSNRSFIIIAYLPTLLFWILDSYFLYQERLFRNLYDHIRNQQTTDYSMHTKNVNNIKIKWINAAKSTTIIVFYLPLILVLLIFMFLIK